MLELLIIGAGPTGLYAAFLAGLRRLESAMIESLPEAGGQLIAVYKEKAIYDIPGFPKITAEDYVKEAYKQYQRFEKQIPIYYNQEALEINKKADYYEVVTNGHIFLTQTILIAHGGGSFIPQRIKTDKPYNNILYFIENIEQYRHKKMVVLGGGDSALDWATSLLEVTSDVTIIHRRTAFRALASSVEEFREKGGKILTPHVIDAYEGDISLKALVLKNTETQEMIKIDTDYVVVNYGFLLSKSKLDDWGIAGEKGLIKVDTTMKTNLNGIYAAGNGVAYPGKVKLISTGLGEAATAIGAIADLLYPERSTNTEHSSSLITE